MDHGPALVVGFVDLVDEREAENVVPPLRGDVAIGDRQVDMGQAEDLWHGRILREQTQKHPKSTKNADFCVFSRVRT
jgi:hypothetical protein